MALYLLKVSVGLLYVIYFSILFVLLLFFTSLSVYMFKQISSIFPFLLISFNSFQVNICLIGYLFSDVMLLNVIVSLLTLILLSFFVMMKVLKHFQIIFSFDFGEIVPV
jgi:hypothetical protein